MTMKMSLLRYKFIFIFFFPNFLLKRYLQKESVEETLYLDPYEQTHSHELAIKESNSAIDHHKKLLLDPEHVEETNLNQETIERHEHAIKIHEVFLKKVQV